MKTTTFYNVTVSIEASDSKEAYTKLCNALAPIAADWITDKFDEDHDVENMHDTSLLFPESGS